MKHQVRILNFSISLGKSLQEVEQEMAQLLDEGYKVSVATGYTVGQGGSERGGAFIVLVKEGVDTP